MCVFFELFNLKVNNLYKRQNQGLNIIDCNYQIFKILKQQLVCIGRSRQPAF